MPYGVQTHPSMSSHWNTDSSQYNKSGNTVAKSEQISEMETEDIS